MIDVTVDGYNRMVDERDELIVLLAHANDDIAMLKKEVEYYRRHDQRVADIPEKLCKI